MSSKITDLTLATAEGTDELPINRAGTDFKVTAGSLASLVAAGSGARAFVTDANATTFLSTVAGGGANKVPVVSDGTNWLIG